MPLKNVDKVERDLVKISGAWRASHSLLAWPAFDCLYRISFDLVDKQGWQERKHSTNPFLIAHLSFFSETSGHFDLDAELKSGPSAVEPQKLRFKRQQRHWNPASIGASAVFK